TARVGEGDDERVIDTTDEETAADEGVDTSEREFGPRTIVLGEGHIFEQVEDDIVGEEVGYSNTVVVPAEEAFGEYDPEDVETVSAKKIDEDDRRPGAQVQVDGRQGYVETIIGGRARVDFNHPLAGDDVTYDFEVVDEIEDTVERAEGYIELQTDAEVDVSLGTETRTETRVEGEGDEDDEDAEEVEEEVEVDTLYIEAPQELSMNQQWVMMKSQIVHELMHDFDVERVVVRET
ncbi:MAG: peptidylprolyl isomerase, partial [Halobacteria archaeon]|nr:peptidylprolyl isomerase [Halobacteria archaeon]